MLSPLLSFLLASAFPLIILSLTILLSLRSPPSREKLTPFECGFDPKNNARLPFSLRFFLLAIIFLVFDIEIILLLPVPLSSLPLTWPSTVAFLIILLFGLLHEWQEGSLEWQS